MHVQLGNVAPLAPQGASASSGPGSGKKDVPLKGQRVTTILPPDGDSLLEIAVTIRNVWPRHSSEAPAWVESDNKALELVLCEQFGCRAGRPKNWKETTE